jgi:hypothetical protein
MESLLRALDVMVEDLSPEQKQKLADVATRITPEKLSAKEALKIVDEVGLDIEKLQKNARKARADYFKATRKPKIGANELCPCGSEKKYKKCCRAKVLQPTITATPVGAQTPLNPPPPTSLVGPSM